MLRRNKERQFEQIFLDHIETSVACARELLAIFENFSSAAERTTKIIELEHQADKLVGETYRRLDNTFISRYDKPDIERLITDLDNVIDYMKKVAINLEVYRITELRPETAEFGRIIVEILQPIQAMIKEMPNLSMDTLQKQVLHVKELEERADTLVNKAKQMLFEQEHDFKNIIKWKDIFEELETVTDYAEDVINTLSTIIRKESL